MQSVIKHKSSSDDAQHWEPSVGGCLLIAGCLLGVVILGSAAIYVAWSRAAKPRVVEQLAELRAQGQPTTPEELGAHYARPPEDKDVTPLLLRAIRRIDTPQFHAAARDLPVVGKAEREIPVPGQTWKDLSAARDLLDQYAGALQQLHSAADAGGAARFQCIARGSSCFPTRRQTHLLQFFLRNQARVAASVACWNPSQAITSRKYLAGLA